MAKAFPGGEDQFQMYAKYYGKLASRSPGPCLGVAFGCKVNGRALAFMAIIH